MSEVLEYKLGLDPKNAIKATVHLQKQMHRRLKLIQKDEFKLTKEMGEFIKKMDKVKKVYSPQLQKQLEIYRGIAKAIGESDRAIAKLQKDIDKYDDTLKGLHKRSSEASGNDKAMIQQQIKQYEDLKKEKEEAIGEEKGRKKTLEAGQVAARKGAREAKAMIADAKIEIPPGAFSKAARSAGEEVAKPMESFMKKDFKAAFGEAGKLLVKGGKGFAAVGRVDPKMIKGEGPMGRNRMAAGMARGMARMSKALAPLIEGFSKFAPMLGLAASGIFALFKLFMDAEAAAKDFHKGILETTSTAGYLSRSMGLVGDASAALEEDLKAVRDGAMDLSNVQWGISKDTAKALITQLTAEGMTLRRLREETERATGGITNMAQTIQMSVAYSRHFGVSLQELSQLQGEMMVEMGMGLDSVQASFETMARGAEEAGMAANKFFGLVKSFSADLTLFTLRMADLTKVMSVLGKTMSPRNAQKFMQAITGKFGGGILENLRAVMIAGPGKARAIGKEDVAGRLKGLGADIRSATGESSEEIIGIIKDTSKSATEVSRELAKWAANKQGKVSGALLESMQDAANMQRAFTRGSALDMAAVADQLSPLGKIELLQAQSMKMFGGKRLEELSGQQLAAVEATGIATVQEIRGYKKLQLGVMTAQEELIVRVRDGNMKLEDANTIAAMGVDVTGKDNEQIIGALKEQFKLDKSGKKTFNALSTDQQEALKKSTETIDYQKQISDKQTSIMDKLGILADILMNYVYNTLKGVWDTILDIWGMLPWFAGDKAEREKKVRAKRFEVQAGALGPEATKIIKDVEGSIWDERNELMRTMGARYLAKTKQAEEERKQLVEKLNATKNEEEKEQFRGRIGQLNKVIAAGKKLKKEEGIFDVAPEEAVKRLQAFQEVEGIEVKGATGKAPSPAPAAAKPTAAAPPAPVEVKDKDKPTEKTAKEQKKEMAKVVKETTKASRQFAKPPTGYKKAVTDSTLEAIRTGLFEYYMYSAIDQATMAKGLQMGLKPEEIPGKLIEEATKKGEAPMATFAGMMEQAEKEKGAQAGGLVASIADGKATLSRLPPGEGWTPIGVGERILPAGARGGGGNVKVELALKGDFGRFIQARIIEGNADFERNKRLR